MYVADATFGHLDHLDPHLTIFRMFRKVGAQVKARGDLLLLGTLSSHLYW